MSKTLCDNFQDRANIPNLSLSPIFLLNSLYPILGVSINGIKWRIFACQNYFEMQPPLIHSLVELKSVTSDGKINATTQIILFYCLIYCIISKVFVSKIV